MENSIENQNISLQLLSLSLDGELTREKIIELNTEAYLSAFKKIEDMKVKDD